MGRGTDTEMGRLSRQECLTRLASTELGRIGVTVHALPVILPVHFAVVDELIQFGTTRNTRVDTATSGAVIAFQADGYDSVADTWWTVLLQGIAAPVDLREAVDGTDLPTSKIWSVAPGDTQVFRLSSDNMFGRAFPGFVRPFPVQRT